MYNKPKNDAWQGIYSMFSFDRYGYVDGITINVHKHFNQEIRMHGTYLT